MAEDESTAPDEAGRQSAIRRWPPRAMRALRWAGTALFVLLLLFAATVAWLHTAPGRQFIVDQIAKVAPASGLSVRVGRIEGSVLWGSTLYDVELRDANDVLFLEIPEVDLNWRPYKFPFTGLDVRHLVLHDGTLHAAPELLPGDPDAPILPDFDIRIDRFVVDDLRIAEGLLGEERLIDFRARADIRDGRVLLDANGDLGGGDVLTALIDAEPDGDRFVVNLDYRAPAGGLLAELVGASEDMRARIVGDGSWESWTGALVVDRGDINLAAVRIRNNGGLYRLVGQARPSEYLSGLPAAALGEVVSLALVGTLENSVLRGGYALRGAGINGDGEGVIDLANNAVQGLALRAELLDPRLFGDGVTLSDARLDATLDGPFRDLAVLHRLSIGRLDASGTVLTDLVQEGTLVWDGTRATLPLQLQVARVVSGNGIIDPRLVNGRGTGTVVYSDGRLASDNLAIRFRGLQADLALSGDLDRGLYGLAGPVRAQGLALEGLGTADAQARIQLRVGGRPAWLLQADFNGRMARVTNATLANLAGEDIGFRGGVTLGAGQPVVFRRASLTASKLQLMLDGRVDAGRTTLAGNGQHVDYGDFTVEAELADDGPRAVLVFSEPLPAAGLRNVRVALSPTEDGFAIETDGESMLGPFDGLLELVSPEEGPTRIAIQRLDVSQTSVTGDLTLDDGGIAGDLALAGGGVDGTIAFAPDVSGQRFAVDINASNAEFGGETKLTIRQAAIDANGFFGDGTSTINGEMRAAGIAYGNFFLGRLAARAQVNDGVGDFDATLAGRRGEQFDLDLTGRVAPERIALAARGTYAGRNIAMPRRAVLLGTEDGGWRLERTQLSLGNGMVIAEGRFGGTEPMQGRVSLARMPLSLTDVVAGDMGLGGSVSGIIDVQAGADGVPTGEARVMVEGLTRSGLVLTSRPINLALVARLTPDQLAARAVMENRSGSTRGRLQARIANLPAAGSLVERLYAGNLFAQARYDGPAASLWRLAAIDLIDIRGPLRLAADVRGTLGNPQVRGSLAGDSLRVQSALTGTDLDGVRARGRFAGSRLQLTSFAGTAANGGQVSGSGFIDLAGLSATRGPRIDLRLAMRDAQVMDLPTMGATVTGPMRIISDGTGGTIAGRLRVRQARWALGVADEAEQLPDIAVTEINLPLDYAPIARQSAPWRYLIDASAPGGIEVDGMGLDSEWRGDIRLRGTTEDPRIGGQVTIVPRQGFYSFAGVRFDITRGVIDFDQSMPIDPRINLLAETEVDGLSVDVSITGSASRPAIVFNSSQGLPQEEILARLLFGGSVANLTATDALQLGAALASLQGGGGLGPINQLRGAIGLDRLRLLPSDPALERGTSVALGKNFGRRFYVEIITDGAGYNATEVEFRITSWLSLLASINSLGRGETSLEFSRDY